MALVGGWVGGCGGWGGWSEIFSHRPWHLDNGALSKNDDVLAEDGELLHVLPLAVHLKFFFTDK